MDRKCLIKIILFPGLGLILVFALISAALLIAVFVKGLESSPAAYISYFFAFYSLCVLCLFCWKSLPLCRKNIKVGLDNNKFARHYMSDPAFRTQVSLYRSLAINLIYVAFNAGFALFYKTHWFAIFAIYYAILAVMRFLLAGYVSKNRIGTNRPGELRRSRLCAYILLTVNLALSGAVLMMVYFRRGFENHGIFIYVMAMYTFYMAIAAIADLCRYKKYHSPIMSMTKLIKMAAALVSLLPLETAMFSQFGANMSISTQRIMIMATGGGIAVIVITMSLYMIIKSTKEIRSLK